MMASLTRRYHFSASHRLHSPAFTDEQNAELYGKCNNPFGHGHDYVLSVTVSGPIVAHTGLIVQRADLDRLVANEVLHLFAHRNINLDVPQFASLVPTTENIAVVILDLLQRNWHTYIGKRDVCLTRVHIQETERNEFEILVPRAVNDNREIRNESDIVHA